jgi:two-component system, OmpR family, heavy metal sensor histidine kinase CusS
MWSKMKSLSFKLTVIYVISAVILTTGIIAYVEYNKYQRDIWDTLRQTEAGPGFINGATPNMAEMGIVTNGNNREYAITGADISNRMQRFQTFFDWKGPKGVGVSTSLDGPVTIENQEYYSLRFKISYLDGQTTTVRVPDDYDEEVGPIIIPKNSFQNTILSHTNGSMMRDYYYLPVAGHENLIYVVTTDRYSIPEDWKVMAVNDLVMAVPYIVILSIIFGLAIAWITTAPLRGITMVIERLSHSNLNQRVKYKSGDEIGRLAQSFNTMAGRLEEAFTSQKRFVSDAAHELRTPLASMKTAVTGALSREKNSADCQPLLEFISGRVNHMEGMVNDLLYISRLDENRHQDEEARLDMSPVMQEAGEAFRYIYEEKSIAFTSEIGTDLFVKGERKAMLRLISNLLDNTAKNTPAGGRVNLSAQQEGKTVKITISDTGNGIPAEDAEHIFDRFYKVRGQASGDAGYGLGLAICKSIVTAAGGSIEVESEVGKGSVFRVRLPVITTP